ncbi:MAG TPA: Hsp20/alpha crystallin family protein [Thermoleophilaceae bacterium]|nr:Hsp20/alpha crystallin family protein [Thermoleophilaceae bacterium]
MSFLTKPDPFSTDVGRLFNTLLAPETGRSQRWSPAMDLVEAEDHYLLRADLPGMGEDDVSIEINDNVLTVSGERRDEQEHQGQGWHRVERTFGRFSRSLALPEGVDPDAVAASFDRGVLSIRVPKPEQRKPRRVAISVGDQRPATEERPAVEGTASEPAVEGAASEPAVEGAPSERL